MPVAEDPTRRLHELLGRLYDKDTARVATSRLIELLDGYQGLGTTDVLLDETDLVLIADTDTVTEPERPLLQTLRTFLRQHTQGKVPGLHLLPHYPSTSDDGFAVADYAAVEPVLGGWRDVEVLGAESRPRAGRGREPLVRFTRLVHRWLRAH